MKQNSLPEPGQQYVDQLGLVWESQGLSRIAGRIVGLLTLNEQPLSLDDIAGALNVSKGSVSQDARSLTALGLVARVPSSKPGDRRDFYAIAPDLPAALINRRIGEIERLQVALQAAADHEGTAATVRERVKRFQHFQRTVITVLRDLSAQLAADPTFKSTTP
jgi:DNA-binding transcriptional regulator GbsR (MarR family)